MKKYLGGKIGPGDIGPEAAPTSSTTLKPASEAGGACVRFRRNGSNGPIYTRERLMGRGKTVSEENDRAGK